MTYAFRYRPIGRQYSTGYEDATDANDAADVMIRHPDRFLLNRDDLLEAQGGLATVGLSLGLVAFGTLLIFAGSPRIATHFRQGQFGVYDWMCMGASSLLWYNVGNMAGT